MRLINKDKRKTVCHSVTGCLNFNRTTCIADSLKYVDSHSIWAGSGLVFNNAFCPSFSCNAFVTKIARMIEASRNNIYDYCYFMEQAGFIMQLRDTGDGIGQLGKVDKVYIDNTNLIFALAEENPDTGNIRETFFFNQMRVKNNVYCSEKGDFNINNITFEVGGKSKSREQIKDLKNAYIVKDNIEYSHLNVLPLWAFGLNY